MNTTKEFQTTTIRFHNDSIKRLKDLCNVYQVSHSDLINYLLMEKHQDQFLKKIPL